MKLFFCVILATLYAGPTLVTSACQDADDNWHTCGNNTASNSRSILEKLSVWDWVAIGVGGLFFLLLIIIGICCYCGCCNHCRERESQDFVPISTMSSSTQIPMTSPISMGAIGPYGYRKFAHT